MGKDEKENRETLASNQERLFSLKECIQPILLNMTMPGSIELALQKRKMSIETMSNSTNFII